MATELQGKTLRHLKENMENIRLLKKASATRLITENVGRLLGENIADIALLSRKLTGVIMKNVTIHLAKTKIDISLHEENVNVCVYSARAGLQLCLPREAI